MKAETIVEKLERLAKRRRLIKSKKLKRIKDKTLRYGQLSSDDDEEDYDDDLLSQSELMEEALKEYMYQFGLSIYQNKRGDYYFKSFNENYDNRGMDELDNHLFTMRAREPNFIEKLLETIPENKVCLNKDIEGTVMDLSDKDIIMSDILEQMIEREIDKCDEVLKETEVTERDGMTKAEVVLESEKTYFEVEENQEPVEENVAEIDEYEVSNMPDDADSDPDPDDEGAPTQWGESYECGGEGERVEKTHLPRPNQIRRLNKNQETQESVLAASMTKDNGNNR